MQKKVKTNISFQNIYDILKGKAEITGCLDCTNCHDCDDELFAKARSIRASKTGSKIFVYGFIYLSTYCHNSCSFCSYSVKNTGLERYRKSIDDVLKIAEQLAKDGVHLLDLTLGEDPYFLAEKGFCELLEMIRKAKELTGLSIMVSPGVLPESYYKRLREAGADWYACYQENHNKQEFARLRPEQDYELRKNARKWAHEAGLLVEDGLLTGTGESLESIAHSIESFHENPLSQARIMSYVGHETTIPMQSITRDTELRAIALIRLANPDYLIPASLDIDGLKGLKSRIEAGANLVTSIVPHGFGLCGVASQDDIENQQRSVKAVKECLADLDLEVATVQEYQAWLEKRRDFLNNR